MGLHQLTLRNFRLFREYRVEPDPDAVTVFLSPNGTGKTSVLEAVYSLATGSSFRTSSAADMVRNGESSSEIHGVAFQGERRIQVDLTLTKGTRNTTKRMLVNGQRPRSRVELSEALPLSVFTPEGVDVIRGGPEHRRTFLTNLLSDVEPLAADVIERFSRVLSQRNALLRVLDGQHPSATQRDELELWNEDFVRVSEDLLSRRENIVSELVPHTSHFYTELSGESVAVVTRYERSWSGDLGTALKASFHDDRYRGYTTIGPHRDDLRFLLYGRDTRRQASQGEQRSLALALRLAGHELVRVRRGVEPLLLLDDVFSELDTMRSMRLLDLLPVGQTLVTTASEVPDGLSAAVIIDLTRLS